MMQPFIFDNETVALYHFDEGSGNKAHSACGDPTLMLVAKEAQWGERPGGGAVARFERREDDATVFVGPVNHDKLHLRHCTEAWTVEAWVRFIGECGLDRGRTYANICGTDNEGYGLAGVRGGWNMPLANGPDGHKLENGLTPGARFLGSLRGRDPNHDTSGLLFPWSGQGWIGTSTENFIRDTDWHHVVWQFRYADQTHFFFIDGRLINRIQLPLPSHPMREVINDSERVGVPFTVGGFVHSQNPPFLLGVGNFEGEIAELRISRVLRYPVAERLSIVKHQGRATDDLSLIASLGLPYKVVFTTDSAQGSVRWAIVEGGLPAGLTLDAARGVVSGRPTAVTKSPHKVTLQATDESGNNDHHTVAFEVKPGRITTTSFPPAFPGHTFETSIATEHLSHPLRWKLVEGMLPAGLHLNTDRGTVLGTPDVEASIMRYKFHVRATDVRGVIVEKELAIPVLPAVLTSIASDAHTVFLYDWQGKKARLILDVMGDENLALDWTNMGGDRRVAWPGRNGRFPQEPGHGEHGFVSLSKNNDKHNLRTCLKEWTVEAWVRCGGPITGWGSGKPFDYGHICGTYDNSGQGVWELYLSDHGSPDGSMAVGVHFFGAEPEQALKDLHPWKRPTGIVGDPANAGIRDTEWHHLAWQYSYEDDLHQLFLDGSLIWQMRGPDGRRLVNNRQHHAQFSVFSRIKGYVLRGGPFNWKGFGNFFGQIGEIRVSNIRRYTSIKKS